MKNELLARAMTEIDVALIAEADERPAKKGFTQITLVKNIYRWGSVAACAMIMVGIFAFGIFGRNDVLLYGESIADSPRTVSEYMPRAVAHMIDTIDVEIPLELDFGRKTALTVAGGEMTVLDKNGNTLYEGKNYTAKGKVSICISLPNDASECIIETDRDYNIVLTRDEISGSWCVNIQK